MKLFDKRTDYRLDFSFSSDDVVEIAASYQGKVSISGAQEKFSAVVDNGRIRLTNEGERGTYILKPAPLNHAISNRKDMPANEYLTMQIASLYGIETAACGLCTDAAGRHVYITRRFDIDSNGHKIKQEDFASVLGRSELTHSGGFKYTGAYEDIAVAIREYVPAWQVAMERFFRILVFNYIYANGDAHLKNFSIMQRNGEYSLTPAYDLLNTHLHINDDDFALSDGLSRQLEKSDVYDRTGHPCRLDFERFATLIGLQEKRAAKILDSLVSLPPSVDALISQSPMNDKMKRLYHRIVDERIHRFIRISE